MADPTTADLYAAVVGRRAAFYVPYFERADARGYAPLSWNWATFLFGVFWLLYRRLYRRAAMLVLGLMLIGFAVGQIALAGYPALAMVVQIVLFTGVFIYMALHANGMYYRWASERIEAARKEFAFDRERQREALAERGGPNVHLPLIIAMVFLLLFLLAPPVGEAPPG